MRKVLSVILTLAVVMTSLSVPLAAFAAAYPTEQSPAIADHDFMNNEYFKSTASYEAVTGMFGKDASDESAKFSETSASSKYFWYEYNHGEEIYKDNGNELSGYLVAEMNFKSENDDFNFLRYSLSERQNPIAYELTSRTPGYRSGSQWNHIRYVYDPTGHEEFVKMTGNETAEEAAQKARTLGKVTTYLNGAKIDEGTIKTDKNYTMPINKVLLQTVSLDATKVHSAYYDDVKLYVSDKNSAQTLTTISDTEKMTVSGDVITALSDITVSDIFDAASNCKYAAAFNNSGLSKRLSQSDVLVAGNVVVTESEDNVYSYYKIAEKGLNIITSQDNGVLSAPLNATKFSYETVSGFAGKDKSDVSMKLTSKTTETASNANMYIETSYKHTDAKYFAFEANVLPETIKRLSFKTNTHAGVAADVAVSDSILKAGVWNKLLMYVDFTGDTPKSTMYINGKTVSENFNTNSDFGTAKNLLRFVFEGAAGEIVYVDDIEMYETDTKPTAAKTDSDVLVQNDLVKIDGGNAYVIPGTTLGSIKADNPDLNIMVFSNSGMTIQLNDSDAINEGNVIVTENEDKVMKYYPVLEYDNTTVLYDIKDFSGFPSFVRTDKSEASGVAGKIDTDTSVRAVEAEGNKEGYFDLSWGKIGGDAENPTWTKLDYNGYLVTEFSVMNDGAKTISLATDQNSVVSNPLADKLTSGQWNRVVVITDRSGGTHNGQSITYVNGKIANDWHDDNIGKIHPTTGMYKNTLRFIYGADQGKGIYVDDVKVYETPTMPIVAPLTLTGEAFSAADGSIKLIGDVPASAISSDSCAIRKYTDSSFSVLLSEDAVLKDGNIIVAEDKNGVLWYYTIKIWDGTTMIIADTPSGVFTGTSELTSGPVLGKADGDLSYKISPNTTNAYYNLSWKQKYSESKYLVYELNIAPDDKFTSAMFGTNGHAAMSPSFTADTGIKKNEWNKIVLVLNIEKSTTDMYINGKLVSEGFSSLYVPGKSDCVRFIVYCEGGYSYIDDMKLYEAVSYPEIETPVTLSDGFNVSGGYFVDNAIGDIRVASGIKASAVKSLFGETPRVEIYTDDTFSTVLDNGDTVYDGCILIAETAEKTYSRYKISNYANNSIIVSGKSYDGETTVKIGTLKLIAPVSDKGVLVAAQYDTDGSLAKVQMDENAVNGCISMDFTPDNITGSKIKLMLIDGLSSFKPLCGAVKLDFVETKNILILGNSFSMDVSWYLRDIAAADGANYNVSVLNKGGSAVAYQYDNREMDLAKSDIMFWYNNQTQRYSNLKTVLADYDWDCVVLQNWGNSRDFYTNTDANYNANWSKMALLAGYVHENEPDAEIMIHETWSFEAGYSFITNEAVRNEISNGIHQLYSRCAADGAAAIGSSEPLKMISSLGAFEAARNYTNEAGIKVFNTTYYPAGHVFTGVENRATVPVGDGSRFVNETERAEGRISLHRDGFHASAAARYLIALNAYETLSGHTVTGNTFRPGSISLDSSASYTNEVTDLDNATSGVIYEKYAPLKEDVVAMLQGIVDNMER